MFPGEANRLDDRVQDLGAGHVEFLLDVNIGGAEEDVDPRMVRGQNRFETFFHVLGQRASETGNDRSVPLPDGLRNLLHRLKIPR